MREFTEEENEAFGRDQNAPMYPRTMGASNGCAIRGCERLVVRTTRFGYVNGRYHGDLCGDHSAAETMLGR